MNTSIRLSCAALAFALALPAAHAFAGNNPTNATNNPPAKANSNTAASPAASPATSTAATPAAASNVVYKWKDSKGISQYSQQPPPKGVKFEVVEPSGAPASPVVDNSKGNNF